MGFKQSFFKPEIYKSIWRGGIYWTRVRKKTKTKIRFTDEKYLSDWIGRDYTWVVERWC